MIAIRSPADLKRSRLPENLHRAVSRVLADVLEAYGGAYKPQDDGFIYVLTPTDTDAYLSERLGKRYQDSMFEGISYDSDTRTWHVIYLQNNQCAISLIISDAEGLDQDIRQRIHRQMDAEGEE
ncbi:MAG: hypothetical protein ABFD75_09885 [Smithella sp.]